ncbi:hypothetical protein C5167_018650, partial [Papaver somniferum]
MFDTLESNLAAKGKVNFDAPTGTGLNEKACFNFLARSWLSTNPAATELGDEAPSRIIPWFSFTVASIAPVGLPCFIEDPLFLTIRLPPCFVKRDYQELYNFFYTNGGGILDEGEKMGIKRDEVCHNLLFFVCFNSFTAMKAHFPNIIKWISRLNLKIQKQLIDEIRSAVKSSEGKVTMKAIEEMPLVKSVIYEVLRLDPAAPYQYAKAKTDLVIESHESTFEVKQGEMLFGYQPIVTKDPKVFERAEEFVADRFVGVEGEKLLKYVVWSNGPETEDPTADDKQCAGKNLVVLFSTFKAFGGGVIYPVVFLLDSNSFPILFDVTKVEKKDLFTGTYMPSTKITGGYRVLSYIYPSEPNHSKLKQLFLSLIHSRSEFIIPEFRRSFGELFDTLESNLAAKGKVNFDAPTGTGLNEEACFNFLARSCLSTNPDDTKLGDEAPSRIIPWFLFTIALISLISLPCFIEDPILHTFRLPSCLLKRGYQKIYNFFYTNAVEFSIKVRRWLIDEIKSAVKSDEGKVTMKAIQEMPLVNSVIYKVL